MWSMHSLQKERSYRPLRCTWATVNALGYTNVITRKRLTQPLPYPLLSLPVSLAFWLRTNRIQSHMTGVRAFGFLCRSGHENHVQLNGSRFPVPGAPDWIPACAHPTQGRKLASSTRCAPVPQTLEIFLWPGHLCTTDQNKSLCGTTEVPSSILMTVRGPRGSTELAPLHRGRAVLTSQRC